MSNKIGARLFKEGAKLPAMFVVLSYIMLLPGYIAILKNRDNNANILLQEYTVLGAIICTIYFVRLLSFATVLPPAYHTDGIFTYR